MKKLLVLFLLISSTAYAQQTKYNIESLRGLKGVNVVVEDLQPNIEADGLGRDSIQADVELELRLAGIRVLTEEERLKEPGCPYLYVNVNSYKDSTIQTYVFSISVELKQDVILMRYLQTVVYGATTWYTSRVGIVRAQMVDDIRDFVKDDVDKFINDYLSVNPR